MGKSDIEIEERKIHNLFEFLHGRDVEGITIAEAHKPNLTPDQAMTVIWFLQECTGVLPDNWEMCDECKLLYDSNHGGTYLDEEMIEFFADEEDLIVPEEYHDNRYCDSCFSGLYFEPKEETL